MPFHIGPTELIIILVIIMIIFGVGKLPQVGGAVGKGLREFRKAQKDDNEEEEAAESLAQTSSREASDREESKST